MDSRAHLLIYFSACSGKGWARSQFWKPFWAVGCHNFMVHQPCLCNAKKIWHPFWWMSGWVFHYCLRAAQTFLLQQKDYLSVSNALWGCLTMVWSLMLSQVPLVLPGSRQTTEDRREKGTHFGALDSLTALDVFNHFYATFFIVVFQVYIGFEANLASM